MARGEAALAAVPITVGPVAAYADAPDGTDQSDHIQTLIDQYDEVVLREGTYLVSSELDPNADGKSLRGMGEFLTYIERNANTTVLNMSGTASGYANHRHFNKVRDLSLDGGGNGAWDAPLMKNYYCDNMTLDGVSFFDSYGEAIRAVEWWDSHIDNVVMDGCGADTDGVNKPALNLLRSEASGFGSSQSDGCNHLNFKNLRVESWRRGAVRIGDGSGDEVRDIHFDNLKTETFTVRGSAVVAQNCNGIHIGTWYVYLGGFASGYSTAASGLYAATARDLDIGKMRFATDSDVGLADSAIWFDGNTTGSVRQVAGILGGDLASGLVKFANASNFVHLHRPIGFLANPSGADLFSGASSSPVTVFGAGTPEASISAAIGSTYQDSTNGLLYVKKTGAGTNTGWKALAEVP